MPSGIDMLSQYNPLKSVGGGFSMGTFAMGLLIFMVVVLILGALGFWIFVNSTKKAYFLRIKVFRNVGNVPTQIAEYRAREIPMGMAGDKLWRVAPNGALAMAFKVVKWLPVGTKQTAKNEFWYWIREDGEWINFIMSDIDEISRQMGVKFTQEDLKLQRLATDRLLEQRLMDKTFWEKYGNIIMTVIFFLVIAVCMVIIFYQWSKLLDKMAPMFDALTKAMGYVQNVCPAFTNSTGGTSGLIPVS